MPQRIIRVRNSLRNIQSASDWTLDENGVSVVFDRDLHRAFFDSKIELNQSQVGCCGCAVILRMKESHGVPA